MSDHRPIEEMRRRAARVDRLDGMDRLLPERVTIFDPLPDGLAEIIARSPKVVEQPLQGEHDPCPRDGDTRRRKARKGSGTLVCVSCATRRVREWVQRKRRRA